MSTPVLVAGFGEVMLRLSPEGKFRFNQAFPGTIRAVFGGGEANVCVSLARFGMPTRYLTALPKNPIADALVAEMRGIGVDTDKILRTEDGRLGIYFAETGANQRGSSVVYDRAGSSIAITAADKYDTKQMLEGVTWLHLSGITPAVSAESCAANLALAEEAAAQGVKISLDLNFRKKLWKWQPGTSQKDLACEQMTKLAALADVIIGNEEDASDVFGIHASDTSVEKGNINSQAYIEVAQKLSEKFPKAKKIAITLRESHSADFNGWGAMLYDVLSQKAYFAPLAEDGSYRPYEIHNIVDRIGGGDSFSAGLVYALSTEEWAEPQKAISFAVAASCLKHSIYGDYNDVSVAEVKNLALGNASGRVSR